MAQSQILYFSSVYLDMDDTGRDSGVLKEVNYSKPKHPALTEAVRQITHKQERTASFRLDHLVGSSVSNVFGIGTERDSMFTDSCCYVFKGRHSGVLVRRIWGIKYSGCDGPMPISIEATTIKDVLCVAKNLGLA